MKHRSITRTALMGAWLWVGCEDGASVTGTAGDAATSSSTSTGAAGSGSSDAGPTGTGTDGGGSASTSTSSGSSSETGEEPIACESGDVLHAFVHDEVGPDVFQLQVDATCDVVTVDPSEGVTSYELACDEGKAAPVVHTLSLSMPEGGGQPLAVDDTIHARIYREYPIDGPFATYVALTSEGDEPLVGYYEWPPRASVPDDVLAWFDLELETFDAGCATELPEEMEPGTAFIIDPCPAEETPMGIQLRWGADSVSLSPGEQQQVGPRLYTGGVSTYTFVGEESCGGDGPRGRVGFVRQAE